MHVIVCVCVCEFQGRNSFKGEECKTRVNLNFFEKWKINCRNNRGCKPEIFYILDNETDLAVGFVSQNLVTEMNFVGFQDSQIFHVFQSNGCLVKPKN